MKNILEVLRRKETELRRLQIEVDSLRVAACLVLEEKDEVNSERTVTQTDMIRSVLVDARAPLHVKDISEAIKKTFGKEIKPGNIAPVVHRQLGKLFVKMDRPNTFGLVEWPVSEPLNGSPTSQIQMRHGAPVFPVNPR